MVALRLPVTPVLRYLVSFSDLSGHQAPTLLDIHVGETLTHIKIKELYPKGVGKKDRKEKKKGNFRLFESFL